MSSAARSMTLYGPVSPISAAMSRPRTVVSGPTLESPLTTVDSRLYVAASRPLGCVVLRRRRRRTGASDRTSPRAAPIAATPQLMPGESVDGSCVDANCVGCWPICALCSSSALWRASVSGTEEAASVRMFDAKDETGTGVGLDEAASVRTFEPGTLDSGEAESVRTSMKSFDAGDEDWIQRSSVGTNVRARARSAAEKPRRCERSTP